MNYRNFISGRALLIAATISITGCASDMSDLQQFVAAEKAKKPGPIEPLPQIKPYETFIYQAQEERSPFKPDTEIAAPQAGDGTGQGGLAPDPNRNKEYLEQFPLDGLAMVGTIRFQGEEYGLVRDSDGAVHRVQKGNYLGQNHGKITQITATEIRLTQIIPDGLGGWMEQQATLGLDE